MGRTWTNKAQLKWLEDRCGAYLKARRDGRIDRFFATTYDAWFELFPTDFEDLTGAPGEHNSEALALRNTVGLENARSVRKKVRGLFFY